MATLQHIGMRKVVVRSEWCQRVSAIGRSGVPNVECPQRFAEIEVDDRFLGEGYGIQTPEGLAAIRLLARLEGLLLDPVYTGKAMAGLIAMIREGRFSDEQNVVFLHTGGWPALFAYEEEARSPSRNFGRECFKLGQARGRRTVLLVVQKPGVRA